MKKAGPVPRARHESEAHRAVARAKSGAKVAPRELSAAPPARRLGGAGRPLPGDARGRLERVFAADLAAVRVHEGPAAAAATRGTRGVASGAHVYLGRGESAGASATFPVLVHEVAHVVQQSGEADEAGRVRVHDVAGTAEPFRWDAPFTDTVVTMATDAFVAAWAVIARTRGDSAAADTIDALVAGLRAAVDANAFWNDRAGHVTGDTADPILAVGTAAAPKLAGLRPLARSALYDGLKLAGKIAAAARLLRLHDDTESGVRRAAVYDSFVTRVGVDYLLDRIVWNWQHLKQLGEARPAKLYAYTAAYLIGVFKDALETPISDVSGAARKQLATDLPSLIDDEIKAETFLPNELQWAAIEAVVGIERYRLAQLTAPADGSVLVVTRNDALDTRLTVSARLIAWTEAVAKRGDAIKGGTDLSFGGTAETRHLLVRDVAPALHGLALYVLDLYRLGGLADRASSNAELAEAAKRGLTADTLRAYAATTPEPYPGVTSGLLALARGFYQRADDGSLPDAAHHAARVGVAAATLTALVRGIQGKLLERISRAWNVPGKPLAFDANQVPVDRNPQLAQGTWLVASLLAYQETIAGYSAQADTDFVAQWTAPVGKLTAPTAAWPGDDLRLMHRGRSARGLLEIAAATGMDELANLLRPITIAQEKWKKGSQQDDVLAIAAPFLPQSRMPLSKLADDMGGGQIERWEQFTIEQLILFFQGDHYRRVADRIDTRLAGAEGKKFELSQVPILNQATTTERESVARPLRHAIEPDGFLYLYRPNDPAAPAPGARTILYQLIKHHPITRATVAGWDNWLVPANQIHPDLVLWRIPTPTGLARFLKAIPAVNALLARFATVDPVVGESAPTADQFAKMTDAAWWSWWVRLTATDVNALQLRRILSLKAIPEVNARLAEYAAVDVIAPTKPPTAAELTALPDDAWVGWFARLTDAVSAALWQPRNLGFRRVPAIDALLETYARTDPGGGTTPAAAAITAMNDADWLAVWKRVLPVATRRREELRTALVGASLADTLSADRAQQWSHLVDRERAALVHERQRVVTVVVLPYLDKYDPTANAWEKVEVHGREVFARSAAETGLDNLMSHFVWTIENEDFVSDANKRWVEIDQVKHWLSAPQERESHQAAAMLSVAYRLRDKVVKLDGADWTMRGWDRAVAWAWLLPLQDTLAFLDTSPALDRFLNAAELPASAWVPDRKLALQNTYDGLFAAMAAHREEFGIVGVGGDGTIENPGGINAIGGGAFGPGHPFKIDGITWEILGVETSFVYHPAMRKQNGPDVLPSLCMIGDEVIDMKGGDGSRLLLRVDRDGETLEIRNNERGDETMRVLAFAAMMAGTVEQLMELAEGMEAGAVFLMGVALDIAELFPVAGQAAAAARVVLGVGSVLADPQFRELVEAFIRDPAGVIDQIWTEFTTNLSFEKIAENVLLNPGLEWLETLSRPKPPQRNTGRTSGGVGRVLRRISSIGRAIGGAVGRAVGFGHDVRDDIQAFVLEHLLLARVLDFVVDHLHWIAQIPELIADWDHLPDRIMAGVKDLFVGMVAAIGRLRLPDRIVTMTDVVEFFLDMVGKRLGGKYALGYTVVKALLQAVSRWDEVVKLISDAIIKLIGDPTKYIDRLMLFINKQFTPVIESAQGVMYDVLAGLYGALPWHTDTLPKPQPINIESTGDQFLDAAPLPREGATRAVIPERVELSGGRPLSPPQRARYQGQLGQDLTHVRLHTGGDAERATRAAGARALTTGSHVLLASDVAPGTDSGDRVLRHELVHVLQQTGPRTDGSSASPSVGEPGRGLRIDPAAEALATEIAAQDLPREVKPGATRGYQPSAIGFGSRFVDYLLHVEKAKPEIERIEKTGTGHGRTLIGAQVKEDVRHVGAAITTWINAFSAASIKTSAHGTFKPAVDKLKAWLVQRGSDLTNAVEDLAIDASEPVGRRADSRESQIMKLDVEAFERKLQRFVVVATGCSIDFELHILTDGKLDRVAPLKKAVFNGLNLAIVAYDKAGKDLWDLMLSNTFTGASQSDVNVRAQTRILLFAYGFGDSPWEPAGGFKLNGKLKAQIEREATKAATITLPEAAEFWHGAVRPTDTTKSALWIGKHGDATHHGMADRQSHHTTQYLLIQFFEQLHALKPFPEMVKPVDAIFTGSMKFALDGKKVNAVDDIAVGTLDPQTARRGTEMPAVLVSSVMHRRGRLHVNPISDTEDDDTPSTQGGRVMTWFMDGLVAEVDKGLAAQYWDALEALKDGTTTATTGASTTAPFDPTTQPVEWLRDKAAILATKLPAAMRRTYREMRGVMLPAIEPALRTLEVTWYEQLALARTKTITSGPFHVTSTMINSVAGEALANNKRIMEDQSKWG